MAFEYICPFGQAILSIFRLPMKHLTESISRPDPAPCRFHHVYGNADPLLPTVPATMPVANHMATINQQEIMNFLNRSVPSVNVTSACCSNAFFLLLLFHHHSIFRFCKGEGQRKSFSFISSHNRWEYPTIYFNRLIKKGSKLPVELTCQVNS